MPHAQTALAARPNPPACRGRAAIAVAAAIAVLPGGALGLGLGEITQQSALGRPLRVVVPVISGPGEELSGECFKLVATPRAGDGIPEVLTGRVALERVGATARLVISSQRPLDDPIVKLTVQAGCENPVRREYTLLLDPLPIETPVVAAQAPARLPESLPASTPGAAGSEAAAPGPTPAAAPAARERPSSAPPAPPRSATARTEPRSPRAAPAPRTARRPAPPPVVAAPKPKLTVSTAVPAAGGGAKPTSEAGLARQQQELADALDAETIVLRQRVAELTATVDRMQKEIEAAQALQAARLAAEEAAKRTPEATIARWWADGWPILAGVFGLAGLIAAILAWRRRRPADEHQEWMHATVAAEPPAQPMPDARTAPPAAPTRTGPDTSGKPTAVAVSELAHVTEEAGVYLAFNRVDRAIEVLEQHIRTATGSLPAAWLMLLELYRRQGRETDFRDVGSEFHRRFNAQTPDWESYPPPSDAEGVEAFPHVVSQLASSWGTAECRAYLDRLLRDNREGRRTGFSLGAYEDLVFLRQLAEIVHAEPPGARGGARLPRPPAQPAAAGPATATKRPPTLDLELELDRDMLDSVRAAPPPGSSGRT